MEVAVVVDEGVVTVTISDEQGYNPDAIDDALRHASAEALRVYRELHPTAKRRT